MDDIYVVEVVSTGDSGFPKDTVAEIAVCRVLSDGSDFDSILSSTINLDPMDLGKDSLDHLDSHHGITTSDLYMGEDQALVVRDYQNLVFGKDCTSFDVNHTFGKYLAFEPWDSTRNLTLLPPIVSRVDRSLREPTEDGRPVLCNVYEKLCPGDPAGVGKGFRALDMASMTASIVMVLRESGFY